MWLKSTVWIRVHWNHRTVMKYVSARGLTIIKTDHIIELIVTIRWCMLLWRKRSVTICQYIFSWTFFDGWTFWTIENSVCHFISLINIDVDKMKLYPAQCNKFSTKQSIYSSSHPYNLIPFGYLKRNHK